MNSVNFHLPGLFESFDFYKLFLPLFYEHREYFYDNVEISSLYGAPSDCIWGGGRFGEGENSPEEVLSFLKQFNISARLTFSNSLLLQEHLDDAKCNRLCSLFNEKGNVKNGIIVHSDLLLSYLREKYPNLYFVSSTTKVLTDFNEIVSEIHRDEFDFVVPDFRLNKQFEKWKSLSYEDKSKVEFLCNECCFTGCKTRKECYENVSRRILYGDCDEFHCTAPEGDKGYIFSKAMENPAFIKSDEIFNAYRSLGFSNFKIEGRGLGTAMLLEFLLYYLTKPEYHLKVREHMYLDSMLDLF